MLKDAWNPQNKFCGKKRVCETLYPVILNVIKLAGAIRKQISGDLIARHSHAECRFGLTWMQEGRLQVIQGAHGAASCDNVWRTAGKTGGTGRVQKCLSENQRQIKKKEESDGAKECRLTPVPRFCESQKWKWGKPYPFDTSVVRTYIYHLTVQDPAGLSFTTKDDTEVKQEGALGTRRTFLILCHELQVD